MGRIIGHPRSPPSWSGVCRPNVVTSWDSPCGGARSARVEGSGARSGGGGLAAGPRRRRWRPHRWRRAPACHTQHCTRNFCGKFSRAPTQLHKSDSTGRRRRRGAEQRGEPAPGHWRSGAPGSGRAPQGASEGAGRAGAEARVSGERATRALPPPRAAMLLPRRRLYRHPRTLAPPAIATELLVRRCRTTSPYRCWKFGIRLRS